MNALDRCGSRHRERRKGSPTFSKNSLEESEELSAKLVVALQTALEQSFVENEAQPYL